MNCASWVGPAGAAAASLAVIFGAANAGAVTLNQVRQQIGADWFIGQTGLDGSGTIIANMEAGFAYAGHQTLDDGKVPHEIIAPGVSVLPAQSHATEVAGVMVAEDNATTGAGIAEGSPLWTGQLATSIVGGSFSISGRSLVYPMMVAGQVGLQDDGSVGGAGAKTADVFNSSWGFPDDSGGNTVVQALYDYLANSAGATMVVAAGNAGQGAGTVGGPANGWNVIAVGATSGTQQNETVTSWSSGGPTPSFDLNGTRTKPDIVAPGSSILMPTTGSPSSYTFASGTSFAAPVVAGAAALLIDYGKDSGRSTDPRVVKSVLLNSAEKLTGWSQQTYTYGDTRINATPLDPSQGTGRVNLVRAYDQYTASSGDAGSAPGVVDAVGWSLDTVARNQPQDYVISDILAGGKELRATLTWFMDRSVVGFDPNSSDGFFGADFYNDGFDDLDLYLFRADDQGNAVGDAIAASISGWDPAEPDSPGTGYDSVEHIFFTLPEDGRYLLRVDYAQELFYFTDDPTFHEARYTEQYALAWSGEAVPEPGTLALLATALLLVAVCLRKRGRKA